MPSEQRHAGRRPKRPAHADHCRLGQSLIESCIVIALLCLAFMGLFQVSQLLAAREVAYHAATRGARAKTVGFNAWMVNKCIRAASIPSAGQMTVPSFTHDDQTLQGQMNSKSGALWDWAVQTWPASEQYQEEAAQIPFYLGAENWALAHDILNYSGWNNIFADVDAGSAVDPMLHIRVWHDYPMSNFWGSVHRAFYDSDHVRVEGHAYIESHYPTYITDMYW